MPPVTRVLIVDDQAPFRNVARTVVGVTPGMEVVGEAKSGEEAIRLAAELGPGIVLMDINLPGISGIEATRRITETDASVRVVLLSTYRQDDLPAEARDCGAVRYVHKEDFEPGILLDVMPGSPTP